MYISNFSLTSALNGGVWSTPRPGRLTPGKDPVPIVYELGGPHDRSGRVRNRPPPTGIRSHELPARSESIYRLSYPGPIYIYIYITNNFVNTVISLLIHLLR